MEAPNHQPDEDLEPGAEVVIAEQCQGRRRVRTLTHDRRARSREDERGDQGDGDGLTHGGRKREYR